MFHHLPEPLMYSINKLLKESYFVRIDYKEFSPGNYKGIYLTKYNSDEKIVNFFSDSFLFDYKMMKLFLDEFRKENPNVDIFITSSVDDYAADPRIKLDVNLHKG
jgi:hypothetical protein